MINYDLPIQPDVNGSARDDASWISWFYHMWGYYSFCEFDDDCMQDDFDDLYGLSNQVAHYNHAFDLILDVEFLHGDSPTEKQNEIVESVAKALWSVSFLLLIDLAKTDCHAKRARRL